MLKFGGLKKGEKIFDLGSGDGRVVIMAAQQSKAMRTGVELDQDLYKQSMDRIKSLGLEKHAHIINGDITQQDFSSANLLTVYLLPNSNEKIRPMLEKQLKKDNPDRRARLHVQRLDRRQGRTYPRRRRRPQPYSVSLYPIGRSRGSLPWFPIRSSCRICGAGT
ncbi:MAG: class I SAM-dependent methyltransferase [Paludibaculum sp.]